MRDAVLKSDVESNIDEYLEKSRSVTQYDLANRFGVRMSVARRILRQKEADGILVPYIREGGLEVYTTPAELEKRESEAPIMIADALEEVASSVPKAAVITEEMDAELIAASSAGSLVKPSRLARKRREAGAKKEKAKAHLPEVIVEPLAPEPVAEEEAAPEPKPKPKAKPKAKPKSKKPTKKKAEEEAKPKKKVTKKKSEEKPKAKKAEPKKKVTKKKAEEDKPKAKKTTKKKAEEEAKPKKKAEDDKPKAKKPAAKKTTTKKASSKKAETKPKKTTTKKTAKKAEAKPKAAKTTKKKSDK